MPKEQRTGAAIASSIINEWMDVSMFVAMFLCMYGIIKMNKTCTSQKQRFGA